MNKIILGLPIVGFLFLIACQHTSSVQNDNRRLIKAEVVALDQDIHFNRFGSHDPYGMIYALKRDVASKDGSSELNPGKVTLRSGKRPRPLVLRMNKGDILEVTFTNLLSPERPSENDGGNTAETGHALISDKDRNLDDPCAAQNPSTGSKDSPLTRCAGIAVSGLPTADKGAPENTGIRSIPPGATTVYRWMAERTGTFLFSSLAAPSGGEGDGGSVVHGLFGAVNVEPEGSIWYRSAVRESDLKRAWTQAQAPAKINYEATYDDGAPVLNLLKKVEADKPVFELIYSPLDAIIVDNNAKEADKKAVREFTVVFHDELKTIFQDDFAILSPEQFTKNLPDGPDKDKKLAYSKQLAGVRDGFGINYGASGMGTMLLANRLQKGPAKHCADCLYEEFFLQSWANGDPALLAEYDDDPSNVHHSYLNDPVKFQNSHAGPKETHVFHLHAHQWLSSASGYANYLDSQTISPQQGFSYQIHHGGSGNRNQTPGDSIFHCHLYPHFAQGMWELWRVHDVFEDGSRKLPDGGDEDILINNRKGRVSVKPGKGTNPLTGVAENGTPIPAIVPLPHRAMPPAPSYGENGFPGFPFYIAGETGHRSPQPPLDIVKDGGLGRHIVIEGERSYPGGENSSNLVTNLINQVKNADLRSELHTAQIKLLPADGTQLEKAAMAFHAGKAKPESYNSVTPEGLPVTFKVNGKAPQPGAPFADPCGKNIHNPDQNFNTRRYRVSAIDLDIQTNEHDWHDPQSRINVLDSEVKHYENHRFVKDAEPFYFRAESGECVEFLHTNRTGKDLTRDDFQVATPTDIIGQHIHLVKFDVTASDGSGNGFNYQDGTMAKATIEELAKASQQPGGSVIGKDGKPEVIKPNGYQQTIQRWWVDPYFHENGYDAGLGTVFTHDHFAPSSIQHHGFYNALLVEPKDSIWLTPSGVQLNGKYKGMDKDCATLKIAGMEGDYHPDQCVESIAVGSRAQILTDRNDVKRHPDTREFALAIADFALLYDKRIEDAPVPKFMEHLHAPYREIRKKEGSPVDPPERPEAISTDHHNPYLINYKHEPIPLRIGKRGSDQHFEMRDKNSPLCPQPHTNIPAQPGDPLIGSVLCHPDDIAYAFSSKKPHGDPFLKPLRAYEGDNVNIRLIQGAQEVQHTFNLHGLSWKREAGNPLAPKTNAQEIGISEHFELSLANLNNISLGGKTADYLFHAGSQDALWNGAWGLIRAFASPESKDPTSCETETGELGDKGMNAPSCKAVGDKTAWKKQNCSSIQDRQDGCVLETLRDNSDGKFKAKEFNSNQEEIRNLLSSGKFCENNIEKFSVEAWQVKDLLGKELFYDSGANVTDPDALVYVKPERVPFYKQLGRVEPLVLRAHAGNCIKVYVTNKLKDLADAQGDALMPKIVSFNVDQNKEITKTQALLSNRVGLHAQLVNYDVRYQDGSMVGFNSDPQPSPNKEMGSGLAMPEQTKPYLWVAAEVSLDKHQDGQEVVKVNAFEEPVAAALTPADPIGQTTHGLFGALVIYPKYATIKEDADSQLSAQINYQDKNGVKHNYREHVVFYQDGLNLHQNSKITQRQTNSAIPDCHICDDSYDLGEKAVNYHSPAFWQRLGLTVNGSPDEKGFDLNDVAFPANFYEPEYKPLPFPDFKAKAGEEMRFVVVHPGGRARQRSFQLYGHTFDLSANDTYGKPTQTEGKHTYGSPWSELMAPGKAQILIVDSAKPGTWLFRDGPSTIFANGSWGRLVVE